LRQGRVGSGVSRCSTRLVIAERCVWFNRAERSSDIAPHRESKCRTQTLHFDCVAHTQTAHCATRVGSIARRKTRATCRTMARPWWRCSGGCRLNELATPRQGWYHFRPRFKSFKQKQSRQVPSSPRGWCSRHAGIRVACGHGCRGQQPNRRQLPEELASKHLSPPPCPTHHGVPTHAGIVAVPFALGKNATLAAMVWWCWADCHGCQRQRYSEHEASAHGHTCRCCSRHSLDNHVQSTPPTNTARHLAQRKAVAQSWRRKVSPLIARSAGGRQRVLWGMHYSTCPTQP
jgi:hypothetical protein